MSDNEQAAPKQFSYGGQAVIEGVMMRGAHKFAIAVRNPDGDIVVHEEPINKMVYRGRISKTPFVRGIIGLWDALGLGTRALMWSADVAVGEEDVSFDGPVGWATIAISLTFGIGLFFLLPTAASAGIESLFGIAQTPEAIEAAEAVEGAATDIASGGLSIGVQHFLVNLLEGVLRLGLVVGYIWLIGRLPDVKRLFGYHGAEHKTINAYEAGADLTPEVVATYPIEHPRCGTAFLLTVVVISVLVFSLFGRPSLPLLLISRVVTIPIIAGLAYEFLRFTARNINNPIVRVIVQPNLALQHLTTREPDLSMIEVAITAFKRVLVSEDVITEEEAKTPQPQTDAPAPSPAGD